MSILKINQFLVAGEHYGKVKTIYNSYGKKVAEATPATPVQVFSLSGPPQSGQRFEAVSTERIAKQKAAAFANLFKSQKKRLATNIEQIKLMIEESKKSVLRFLLKGDASHTEALE